MTPYEGKNYYELAEVIKALEIKGTTWTHYAKRFRERFDTNPIKLSTRNSPKPTWCWEESEFQKIMIMEREYQKGLDLKKNRKKPDTNSNHAMSKGDLAASENRKAGYYTRISGYWRIETEQGEK